MSLVYPARRVRSEINSIDRVNSSSNLGRTGDFSSPDLGNHKKRAVPLSTWASSVAVREPVTGGITNPLRR